MKKWTHAVVRIGAVVAMCALAATTRVEAGNEGAHGGDYGASEFVARAYEVLRALREVPANHALVTDAGREAIAFAILRTPVVSVDTLPCDQNGYQYVACTVSDATSPTGKVIQLQGTRWGALLANQAVVYRLVFHEYLWVIGADDSNYRISTFLQMASVTPQPQPGPDVSEALTIMDTGSSLRYYFYYTDQAGDKGTYQFTGESGTKVFYLNPRRPARVTLFGSATVFCYDRRLTQSINVTNSSAAVSYCYL